MSKTHRFYNGVEEGEAGNLFCRAFVYLMVFGALHNWFIEGAKLIGV